MNTPDITKAQTSAIAQYLASVVAAIVAASQAGIEGTALIAVIVAVTLGAAALGVAQILADAHIRGKRNDRVAYTGPDTVVTTPAGDELTDAQLDDLERAASEAAGS